MAAAGRHARRQHGPENIIKQGYLKKSVRSNDLLPSAPKQLANNIKQKLEPNRWYVFGVRNRQPYLEYYDREESVFTGEPINAFDLSTFETLSYTMGRTNTSFSFCLILADRTIELNAPDRPQMLEWCRCFERNLGNLGLRSKHAKEDHQYVAFPVKREPPVRRSVSPEPLPGVTSQGDQQTDEQDHIYEEAPGLKVPSNDSSKDQSPELPPRLPQRTYKPTHDEEVFASIYSVKRDDLQHQHDYHAFESNHDSEASDLGKAMNNDEEDFNTDTNRTGDNLDKSIDTSHSKSSKLEQSSSIDGTVDDGSDDDEDRCTSLPVMHNKPLESDTSEDSDFISASFWLRNRKTEDLILFDGTNDPEAIKRKLPPLPKNFSSPPPPVPLRHPSERPRPQPRNCVSMNFNIGVPNHKKSGRVSPSLDALGIAPSPPVRKLPEVRHNDLDVKKTSKVPEPVADHVEKTLKENNAVPHLLSKAASDKTCVKSFEDSDDGDGNEYETLDTKITVNNAEASATTDSLYEAAWSLKKPEKCDGKLTVDLPKTDVKSDLKDNCSKMKPVQRSRTSVVDSSKRKSKIKRLISHSKSSFELPDTLVVSLPPDGACNGDASSACGDSPQGGNLYSDFPEKPAVLESIASCDKETKRSPTTETHASGDTSPILPKRIISKRCDDRQTNEIAESRRGDAAGAAGNSCVRNSDINHHKRSPSPPQKKSDRFAFSLSYEEVATDAPVAPPRKHKMISSVKAAQSDGDRSAFKTVINVTESGLDKSNRDNTNEAPARPPLPRRMVTMRKCMSTDTGTGTDLHPGTPARPKSIQITGRQQSVGHSGSVTVMNLKQNQVDILKSEIESSGGMVRSIPKVHFQNGLALVECFEKVWIVGWDLKKYPRLYDKFHIGDQVISINNIQVTEVSFAQKVVKNANGEWIDISIRRLPYAKVFAIQRTSEGENLGIRREGGTAEIVYVDPFGLACRHGLNNRTVTMDGSGSCTWSLTEINMRPLNLFFKDNEIEHRLTAVGKDISIVVQPTDFIRELKKQLRKIRGYKDFLVQ